MNALLRKVHRWLGFPLGVLLLLTFATGMLTAIDELNARRQLLSNAFLAGEHLDLEASSYKGSGVSITEHARTLGMLSERHEDATEITLATKLTPYYQVINRQERVTYGITCAITCVIGGLDQGVRTLRAEGTFFSTVLQLHRNLLMGKKGLFGLGGADYVAWISLISLFISVIGLWFWWPLRRSFKVRTLVPTRNKRADFFYSHVHAGVLCSAFIALMALTGASITFRDFTQQVFGIEAVKPRVSPAVMPNAKLGTNSGVDIKNFDIKEASTGQLAEVILSQSSKDVRERLNEKTKNGSNERVINTRENSTRKNIIISESEWLALLTLAENTFPNATLQRIKIPRTEKDKSSLADVHSLDFRFLDQGDWLGLPSSYLIINRESLSLKLLSRFSDKNLSEKIYAQLKPLHTGKGLPILYTVFLLLMSALGCVMVFSGIYSFVVKNRRVWKVRFPRFFRAFWVESYKVEQD
ncbi:MAG: hypothetical protein ACI93R_003533 [Flavobacteriales bacterium]|jgi:hypothetical protein